MTNQGVTPETQLTTAPDPHADNDPHNELGSVDSEPPILRPAKCRHGLPAHIRPDDGLPTCPLCRREPQEPT